MSARAAWRLEDLGFAQVYRYQPGKADWIAQGWPVAGREANEPTAGTLVTADVPTCRAEERIGDVRPRIERSGWDACAVVNATGVFQGLLRHSALEADPDRTVAEKMHAQARTFRPDVSPDGPLEYMNEQDLDSVVVSTGDGVFLGLLRRTDAERHADAA